MLEFHIHERPPAVTYLAVYLEKGQRIYFTENNVRQQIESPPASTNNFVKSLLYTMKFLNITHLQFWTLVCQHLKNQ